MGNSFCRTPEEETLTHIAAAFNTPTAQTHGYHCWFWMTGLSLVISLLNPVITFDYFRAIQSLTVLDFYYYYYFFNHYFII